MQPVAESGNIRTFTLFYTSDTHGNIVSAPDTIGLDLIASIKSAEPHSLLLDAGDFLHGTRLTDSDQGVSVFTLMKQAGYFATAIGNHEFSYGREALAQVRDIATKPPVLHLLSANVIGQDGRLMFEESATANVNGVQLCVFGITTPDTETHSNPEYVQGLLFNDPETAAASTVEKLQANGCDFIVGLTHLGSDGSTHNSLQLAEPVDGLDVLIDGHSHLVVEHRQGDGALVVSPGAYGKLLGKLDVTFDTRRGKVESIYNTFITPEAASAYSPDPQVSSGIARLLEKDAVAMREVIGYSEARLVFNKSLMRSRETALGDFCADALRNAYGSKPFTNQPLADIAIINSGAIGAALPDGKVTRGDIHALARFGGHVVLLKVNGRELRDILEHAVSFFPAEDGAFAQISGLRAGVDATKAPGSRIVSLELPVSPCIGFEEVKPHDEFVLAVNDYLASGGDGFPHLATKARLREDITLYEALSEHLKNRGSGNYSDADFRIVYHGR
ncbi:5'-nucleotidase C-terminal domain-containing protein [Desulfovibrio sp. OttesenSCG-928-C06]|nr:5'-nucleotidase C-terminal domain-containing protein [Desulfovibrio sp. OttesenSCG-928-C06]